MIDQTLLTRISRLLAMAADVSSPHEAAIAAQRARALMDKHQISMADVPEHAVTGEAMKQMAADRAYRAPPKWKAQLGPAIAKYNDCQCRYDNEGAISFLGYESDVMVAVSIYKYIVGAIDRLCKTYCDLQWLENDTPATSLADSFRKGAAAEIASRLNDMRREREAGMRASTATGLIVVKNQAVAQHFGEVRYVRGNQRYSDGDAYSAGVAAGKSIGLHTQVAGNSSKAVARLK